MRSVTTGERYRTLSPQLYANAPTKVARSQIWKFATSGGKSLIDGCRWRENPQGDRRPTRRSGRTVMSSEHVTEQVPLAEIQEGDTIKDPASGQWFTVTRTADGTTSVTGQALRWRQDGHRGVSRL